MAAQFERYKNWLGYSWSLKRLRSHQTEINDIYWSFVPVASEADYRARKTKTLKSPEKLFHASGPDVHRLANDLGDWRKDFKEFINWTRLSLLMSAASYLELYIESVVKTALISDPLARFGKARMIDGTKLLKVGSEEDLSEYIDGCIKGEWSVKPPCYGPLARRVSGTGGFMLRA